MTVLSVTDTEPTYMLTIVNDYVNTEQSVNVVVDYADTTMTTLTTTPNF